MFKNKNLLIIRNRFAVGTVLSLPLMLSVFFVKHNRHFLIDYLCLPCLMIAELFVQIAIASFLQDRVEFPVLLTVNTLRFFDRFLSVALISVLRHDENRRNSLAGNAVFTVYNTNNADIYIICRYEVVSRFGLVEAEQYILIFFCCRTCFSVLILFLKLRKCFFLHLQDGIQILKFSFNKFYAHLILF